jgi:hypothetical protein
MSGAIQRLRGEACPAGLSLLARSYGSRLASERSERGSKCQLCADCRATLSMPGTEHRNLLIPIG